MKFPLLAAAFSLLALPAAAHDFGFAGVLSNTNKGEMPGILLSVGQPLTDGPIALKSGMVYELEIEADGSGELALEGSGFFRAIWVNEVVVNGLEIRPFGLESVEFDEAGTMPPPSATTCSPAGRSPPATTTTFATSRRCSRRWAASHAPRTPSSSQRGSTTPSTTASPARTRRPPHSSPSSSSRASPTRTPSGGSSA